jgi:hypothetical protein
MRNVLDLVDLDRKLLFGTTREPTPFPEKPSFPLAVTLGE